MYKNLRYTLIVAALFLSVTAIAQPDITITDHRNFKLDAIDSQGNMIPENVHLTVVYESKTSSYTVYTFNKKDQLFTISEPLNRTEFQNQLTASWSNINSNVKGFTTYSFEQVLLWMYSLSQRDGNLRIGTLFLGSFAEVFPNGNVAKNNPDRVRKMQSLINTYNMIQSKFAANKISDTTAISGIINKVKEMAGLIGVDVPDTNFLSRIRETIAKNRFVVLSATDTAKLVPIVLPKTDLQAAQREYQDAVRIQVSTRTDLVRTVSELDSSNSRLTALKNTPANLITNRANHELAMIQEEMRNDSLASRKIILTDSSAFVSTIVSAKKIKLEEVRTKNRALTDQNSGFMQEQRQILEGILYHNRQNDTNLLALRNLEALMIREHVFPIEKISLQFERGHIERIQVWVKNELGFVDIYENIFAIGFSSINNLKAFQSLRLFVRKSERSGFNSCIYLSDALGNYDNVVDLYTRDYSPADTAINAISPDKPVLLEKEKNIRLFDSKIFSDLQGIEDDAPNGLVQIEVARKFNLNTYRWQIGTTRLDIGWVSYLNLYGSINKIENKQKRLPLRNENAVENGVIISPAYASNLDIQRYENASLGIDANGFLLDWPDMKMTLFTNLGMRYGHLLTTDTAYEVVNGSAVKTSQPINGTGNTVTFTVPKVTLEFFSERRIGFTMSYNYNITYLFSNNSFKQVMSYAKSDLTRITTDRSARKSHMAEVFVRVETNREGNGQMFLRSRFFWQQGDASTFFPQIQVGYNYSIIFRK